MLFVRVDVREGLLSNSHYRGARYAEKIEIDLATAASACARDLLERGQAQAQRYNVDVARRLFLEAAEQARQDKDGFIEAAAGMVQTIHMDGMTNTSSQSQFLASALEVLDYELFMQRETLTEMYTPREVALPIMTPRLALRDLIEENLAQYHFRQNSLMLAETKTNCDRHLAAGNWHAAEGVGKIGVGNATEMYGADHWWTAVFMLRQATALLRQNQAPRAKPLIKRAAFVLGEWSDYADNGGVFKQELSILQTAQSDIALVSA